MYCLMMRLKTASFGCPRSPRLDHSRVWTSVVGPAIQASKGFGYSGKEEARRRSKTERLKAGTVWVTLTYTRTLAAVMELYSLGFASRYCLET